MRLIRAPEPLAVDPDQKSIFLAGSIAGIWRALVAEALHDKCVVIWDPSRDDWDSSWRESAADPQFRAQVDWELEAQERADIIAMYLSPESNASVSLIELGLSARTGKVIVCCPDGFWCKELVDAVCRRHNLTTARNLAEMIEELMVAINN